jgi:hypothetical protein
MMGRKEGGMRLRKYWMLATLVSMVLMFLSCNVLAYDMAEYFPLNQGNEWTFSYSYTVEVGETEGEYGPMLMKQIVNGTEVVNQVKTVKLENRTPGSLTPDYDCYAYDSEGLKIYKHHWINYIGTIVILDQGTLIYPAQFNLGEVNEQSISSTAYDSDGTILSTSTGEFTASIELVEDVSVPAGNFEDCLKVTSLASSQASDGSTFSRDYTVWYAHNLGVVKARIVDNFDNPMEEGEGSVTMSSELIRAKVDGIHYGRCPAVFALGEDSNDLHTLRKLRDEVLRETAEGQKIIQLYYELGPAVVKAMGKDKELKKEIKEMIDSILPLLE